jgi:hypothetical protein
LHGFLISFGFEVNLFPWYPFPPVLSYLLKNLIFNIEDSLPMVPKPLNHGIEISEIVLLQDLGL